MNSIILTKSCGSSLLPLHFKCQKYCQLLLLVLCITTIKPIITNQEEGRFICKFSYSYYLYGNADRVNKIL